MPGRSARLAAAFAFVAGAATVILVGMSGKTEPVGLPDVQIGLHGPVADAEPLSRPITTARNELVEPESADEILLMEVTAYCPCRKCCGPRAHGVTASGKPVSFNGGRFVAADTDVLPFGTTLVIPGYDDEQPVEVVDRGGAIVGNRLDVFFPSHREAREWGRQTLPVRVMR